MGNRRIPAVVAAVAGWSTAPAAVAAVAYGDQRLIRLGYADLTQLNAPAVTLILGMFSAATVGAVLVASHPRHPVGWLFLGLGVVLAFDGAGTSYATYGAVAGPGALTGADVIAVLVNADFIAWLVVIGLVLYLTPTGRSVSRGWALAARLTVLCGLIWFAAGVLRPRPLDPPLHTVVNPLAITAAGPVLTVVSAVAGVGTGLGVLLGAGSLLDRYRRSVGAERQRLGWMALVALTLPVSVIAVYAFSYTDHELGVYLAAGGFVALVPVAAGLSVVRFHLYDVDRIVSRALTYLIISGLLACSYLAALFAVGQTLGALAGQSKAAAVAATLAAVAVAAPSYRYVQAGVDRRFNRRQFEALSLVRRFLREPTPGQSVDGVVRDALGDPSVRVAYWIDSRHQWVNADGREVTTSEADVETRRGDRPVARIAYDPAVVDRALAQSVAAEATPELDNAGLRADLAQRLIEVQESRARIAMAQLAERRTVERDLHDGAQQRLLALALQLRAAHGNGDPILLRDTVANGIEELQTAVAELRELANGLYPAVLSSGGLGAALDDLAARIPVPIVVNSSDERSPVTVETTAWFIACEAVTNAVKHADPARIEVTIAHREGWLSVTVRDDGRGGADPQGRGLRGIRDRAEALGGSLHVATGPDGTTITSELPCVS